MPWVEIPTAPAQLALNNRGQLSWNTTLQVLLGDPKWVDLMWESNTRCLGIRKNNAPGGLLVSAQGNEFKINSAAALTAAGISVAETVQATPQEWIQVTANTGWAEWFGYPPIFYITLPTE